MICQGELAVFSKVALVRLRRVEVVEVELS